VFCVFDRKHAVDRELAYQDIIKDSDRAGEISDYTESSDSVTLHRD